MSQYYVDEAGDIKQMPDQRSTFQKILEGLGAAAGEWNNPGTYQKSLHNRNENVSSAMNRVGEQKRGFTHAEGMQNKQFDFTRGENKVDREFRTVERLGNQGFMSGENELSRRASVEAQLRGFSHDIGKAGIDYSNTSALRAQAAADTLALQRDQQAFTLPMQQAQIGFYGSRGDALDRKPDPEAAIDIDKLPAMISLLDADTQKLLLAKIAELTALGKNLTYRDYEALIRTKPASKGVQINTGGFVPTSAAPVPGGNLKL